MKMCTLCDSKENLTKHHISDDGKGTWIYLCITCHQKIHNHVEKHIAKNARSRIRRAQKRILESLKVIATSERILEEHGKYPARRDFEISSKGEE